MIKLPFAWKIAGEAGYGLMNTGGPLFAKCFTRRGYFVFCYPEYPSLIRGGHNVYQVNVDNQPVWGPTKNIDYLVALNAHAIIKHQAEIKPGGWLVYDPQTVKLIKTGKKQKIDNSRIPTLTGAASVSEARAETFLRTNFKLYPAPLIEIAAQAGDKIMQNVVSVGVSLALLRGDFAVLTEILQEMFGKKGKAVVAANLKAARGGYEYVKK